MHNPWIRQLGLSTFKVDTEMSSKLFALGSKTAALLGTATATVLKSARMNAKEETRTRIAVLVLFAVRCGCLK